MTLRGGLAVAINSVRDFFAHDAPQHAAAITFYTLLSLAPLLLITVALAGTVADDVLVREELTSQFESLVGDEGGRLISGLMDRADQPGQGMIAALTGVVVLLTAGTGAFVQLKHALNAVWGVRPAKGPTRWLVMLRRLVVRRLLSFTMIVVIAFLLLSSLVVSAVLSSVASWSSAHLPVPIPLLQWLNAIGAYLIVTVLFALVFKILPDARVGWREAVIGAAVTALLFSGGKFAMGLYLGRSGVASPYGAAGSVVLVLLWVYYSALILLMGAEITRHTSQQLGKAIAPVPGFEIVG